MEWIWAGPLGRTAGPDRWAGPLGRTAGPHRWPDRVIRMPEPATAARIASADAPRRRHVTRIQFAGIT